MSPRRRLVPLVAALVLSAHLVAPAALAQEHDHPEGHDGAHRMLDEAINSFVLVDRLEWRTGDEGGASWDGTGWIGRDLDRFWFRTAGGTRAGSLDRAGADLLYGRAVARWWDLVAGVRQDWRPGRPQTWAAIGVQGLAPYFFEVEATAYIGAAGRTAFRVDATYDLLITNRLILQPTAEIEVLGREDAARGLAAGIAGREIGARLRYEIRREFAPYAGLHWGRGANRAAGAADARQESNDGLAFVVGGRVWF